MKNLYLTLTSIFVVGFVSLSHAQITGDSSVCEGEIQKYTVPTVSGATYLWNVSGGTISGSNNADSLWVSWPVTGTGTVSVTINLPNNTQVSYTLAIVVHSLPNPSITHLPYPTCPPNSQGEQGSAGPDHGSQPQCDNVCQLATLVYSTTLHAGSTYQWTATGSLSLSGQTTHTVTVTWDASSTGSLTVVETNQWGCVDSATICVKKMPLPVAQFTHPANVCKGSSVAFTNLSTGAVSYQWDFGDGSGSAQQQPTHAYNNGGTYTITLIAMSNCYCSDTIQSTITVSSLPGPDISCPSTVCAFDTATYSTSTSGCNYNWFATGGTILGPSNQQSVNVVWGAGQLGYLGLYVSGCTGLCSDTTWITIPILPSTGVISGPAKVCPGDCETFSLPKFSGATYTWSLNSGSCGMISDSSCCEEIEICWPAYITICTDTLTVTYYDAFLGCGGTATKVIRVRPQLNIFGLEEGCSNASSTFSAYAGVVCNWNVYPVGPVLSPSPAPSLSVNWNGSTGTFMITAVPINPNQVCNDSAYTFIKVINPPAAPVVTGDTVVCPGSTFQYCATGTGTIHWNITGGTPSTGMGSCLTVTWSNTPPFAVNAYIQMPSSPYCSSDTATLNITVPVSNANPQILGPHTVCANATNNFNAPTPFPAGALYTWSLTPANSGTILSGQGSNAIQVEWGNNAPQTVVLQLDVDVCGSILSDTFHITLKTPPVPVITQTGNLCPGSSAQLNATGGSFTAYQWTGPGGFTASVNPVTITQNGLYQLTVTDAGGCTGLTQFTAFYVGVPVASISSQNPLQYCIGSSFSVNLCALGNPNYTYTWSNAATTQCNTVTTAGSFLVTVTDASNGCFAISNVLTVSVDSCVPDTGQVCFPNGSVSFTHSSCNPKVFTNTSVNAGSFTWNFGDFSGSNAASPTHTYNQAGFFLVTLWGKVADVTGTDSCVMQDTALIEVPLLSRYNFTQGCFGDPVCFTDLSVFTAGNNITSWSWNFGDANGSSLQNPCHTYSNPGTYFVTLTISNPNCTTSWTDTVVITPKPTAAFGFSNVNCAKAPIAFTDNSIFGINYWNWDFGNGGTSLNQNPSQSYQNAGTYPVTLIVHDTAGCYDTLTQNVTVYAPIGSGTITAYPDTIVCAGTPVTLVAPACTGCSFQWNTGSINDTIVVTATGIYSVAITDSNGCIYNTSIKIIVNQPPLAMITSTKDELCLGEYTLVTVPFNPDWLYTWISNDPNVNGSTSSSVFTQPASPGVYTYQVFILDTVTGCSDTTLLKVIPVHQPPVPPIISSIGVSTVCQGDSVWLVVTHPDPSVTFKWNTGQVNDTIFVTKDGCYTAMVTDTNGCTSQSTFCVTVHPLPELCSFYEGCFDTCAPYTILGPPGNATYQWVLNGNPISGATSQNYTATTGGAYSLIVSNSFGCVDTTGVLNLNLYPCSEDTSCCHIQFISDSIWCETGWEGETAYHFSFIVEGCGPLYLTPLNFGPISLNNPYYLTGGIDTISGMYYDITDSLLCLNFAIHDSVNCCPDTTLCFWLPECNPPVDPCDNLTANFTFTTNGLNASFTDLSTASGGMVILAYSWNFGDPASGPNNTSAWQNPSHTFTAPGSYVVCLYVIGMMPGTGLICSDVICMPMMITEIGQDPCDSVSVAFNYSVNGLLGSFTDLSVSSPLVITSWLWDFGDPASGINNSSGLQNPTHTFSGPGNYMICLTITALDPLNPETVQCMDKICQNIFVEGNPIDPCDSVWASFTYSANLLTSSFTDLTTVPTGFSITSWSWNFGDQASGANNFSNLANPVHLFSGNGFYLVCLTVTASNADGSAICTDSICMDVFVEGPVVNLCDSLVTTFTFNQNGANVNFTDVSTVVPLAISSWSWNFGDPASGPNNFSVLQNPVHVFSGPGTYVVCLTITATDPVDPAAVFCEETFCRTITIEEPPFNPCDSVWASFTYSANLLTGSFTDLTTVPTGFSITSWSWNFGDPASGANNFSNLANPVHLFSGNGFYLVCLTVTASNADGSAICTDSICMDVFVEGPVVNLCDSLVASFTFTQNGTNVIFSNLSSATPLVISSCYWDFGDPASGLNNFSFLQSPVHNFSGPGIYQVCLTVTATDPEDPAAVFCEKTICSYITIGEPPFDPCDSLTASFTYSANGLIVNFNNQSSSANNLVITTWNWNFGDPASGPNNTSVFPNPSHTFTAPGTYLVCLIVSTYNMEEPNHPFCNDTLCISIVVVDNVVYSCDSLHANFSVQPGTQTRTFTDLSTATGGLTIVNWSWNFGDPASGANNTSTLQNPTHTFSSSGLFQVCLIITAINPVDLMCYDTLCVMVPVSVIIVNAGPDITIYLGSASMLWGTVMGGVPPYTFTWTPYTGLSDPFIQNPEVSPSASTTYTLVVTDSEGNSGSDEVVVTVMPIPGSTIIGTVYYDNLTSTPLSNTAVDLMSGPVLMQSDTTNSTGNYVMSDIPNGNYQLLSSSTKPWGGVNATDALLMLRHFVGTSILTGIRRTAGDVDGSGYVNSNDALTAMKRFVGVIPGFITGDWTFEKPEYNILVSTTIVSSFKGLCMGDVNGSYLPPVKAEPSLSLEKSGIAIINDDGTAILPLSMKQEDNYGALSLVLNYPEDAFEILGVEPENGNGLLVYHASEGQLRIAWCTLDAVRNLEKEPILNIRIKVRQPFNILTTESVFTLDESSTVADSDARTLSERTLLIPRLATTENRFYVEQNIPNPFSGTTSLAYSLPEPGKVKITLTDVFGKQLRVLTEREQEAGVHHLELDGHTLAEGVYFYQVCFTSATRQDVETRRMVVVH